LRARDFRYRARVDLARLDRIPTVKVAMTPFPWSIDIDEPIGRAREMMEENEIHHLPVTDQGALVGVITGREVALGEALAKARGGAAVRVREVCVLHAYVVADTEPLDRVVATLARERIGSALVTRRGKLVGVFTVTDACRLLADWLRARFPASHGDDVA
jgi:CBS domain-containing protein